MFFLLQAELKVNEAELRLVASASKEFYHCMLTHMDWTELLAEEEDVLGFGLAVK